MIKPETLYAFVGKILAVGMSTTDNLGIFPLDPALPCPNADDWKKVERTIMKMMSRE